MNRGLLAFPAAVAMVAVVSAANAADIAPAPSVYDWSGFHIGLNAGAAWSNSEFDGSLECIDVVVPPPDANCNFFEPLADYYRHGVGDSSGVFTGGAMIGANWQHGSLVLGVEADANYSDFDANDSRNSVLGGPLYIYTNAELDTNWWGTVRGRMGFAADNLLFYGTGGLAWGAVNASGQVDQCSNPECTGPSITARGSESDTLIGWTIGGGLEYGWRNWTLGAEYLYVDLGSTDFDYRVSEINGESLPDGVEYGGSADADIQFSVVRATAKWKF